MSFHLACLLPLRGLPAIVLVMAVLAQGVGLSQEADGEGEKPEKAEEAVSVAPEPLWSKYPLLELRADPAKARKATGGSGTERAVKAALSWLARHQHPEGYWSSKNHREQCRSGRECKNEVSYSASAGPGLPDFDAGLTGLAVLAFTGRGNTHLHADKKEYKEVLAKAAGWLIAQQTVEEGKKKGLIDTESLEQGHYNHALATIALAELLLGSGDKKTLEVPVTLAIDYCLRSQSEGYGWKYAYANGRSDTSLTSWMILAVKLGKLCADAGLVDLPAERFEKPFAWTLKWLDRATSKISGKTGYESPGDPGARLLKSHPEPYPFKKLSACTAAAVFVRELLAEGDSEAKDMGTQLLLADLPSWLPPVSGTKRMSTLNFYYWYYGSLALFQGDSKHWTLWNKALKRSLLNNRRKTGCAKGSWDPVDEWGPAGGRVYSTAINALSLEVYYRYQRVNAESR